jgi:hypothetical protein
MSGSPGTAPLGPPSTGSLNVDAALPSRLTSHARQGAYRARRYARVGANAQLLDSADRNRRFANTRGARRDLPGGRRRPPAVGPEPR